MLNPRLPYTEREFTKRPFTKRAGGLSSYAFWAKPAFELNLLGGGQVFPFLGRIPGRCRRAAEILLRQKRAHLVHGEHGLLRPKHVRTLRIGRGRHDFLKIRSDLRDQRLGLGSVASMQVDDEIPEARKHVR